MKQLEPKGLQSMRLAESQCFSCVCESAHVRVQAQVYRHDVYTRMYWKDVIYLDQQAARKHKATAGNADILK